MNVAIKVSEEVT